MALNVRQQRFVDGIMAGKPATEAYRAAGYRCSARAAEPSASELLRHPEVVDERGRRRAVVEASTGITKASVLRRLDEVANRCMQAVPVMEYDRLVEGYVQKTDDEGRGVWEFDSAGANRALELLGKHLGLFVQRVEHTGKDGAPIQVITAVPASPEA